MNQPRKRPGFTLIELLAVSVLLVILSSVAVISLLGHLERAHLETLLTRLETLDARIRDDARRRNLPLELRIDVDQGRVDQYEASSAPSSDASRRFTLTGGIQIDQIRTPQDESTGGQLQLLISPRGQSDTYAVCLHTPRGVRTWLVVLGVTGQCIRFKNDADVDNLFSLLDAAAGIYAH